MMILLNDFTISVFSMFNVVYSVNSSYSRPIALVLMLSVLPCATLNKFCLLSSVFSSVFYEDTNQ